MLLQRILPRISYGLRSSRMKDFIYLCKRNIRVRNYVLEHWKWISGILLCYRRVKICHRRMNGFCWISCCMTGHYLCGVIRWNCHGNYLTRSCINGRHGIRRADHCCFIPRARRVRRNDTIFYRRGDDIIILKSLPAGKNSGR